MDPGEPQGAQQRQIHALHPQHGQLQQEGNQQVGNELFPSTRHLQGHITHAVSQTPPLTTGEVLIHPWRRLEHTSYRRG